MTGDLQYFVDGLKSIADILINQDESASKDGEGDGISRTIAGLFNFAVSAETLLRSEELTRYEFATLVHAIFAGCSLAQVLIDIYQNHCFLSKYSSDEYLVKKSMRLYDVLGHAKNYSTKNNNKVVKGKMGQIHKGMSQEERRKAQKKQLVKEAKDTDEVGPQDTNAITFRKEHERCLKACEGDKSPRCLEDCCLKVVLRGNSSEGRLVSQTKMKCSSKAFSSNSLKDKGTTPREGKGCPKASTVQKGFEEKKVKTTAVKSVGMTIATAVDNENSVNVSNSILILFYCLPLIIISSHCTFDYSTIVITTLRVLRPLLTLVSRRWVTS